jgi:hypothetical protein
MTPFLQIQTAEKVDRHAEVRQPAYRRPLFFMDPGCKGLGLVFVGRRRESWWGAKSRSIDGIL